MADAASFTGPIAQIDKNHAAMVATAVDPAAQGHGLTQQGLGHQTAVFGTHCHIELSRNIGDGASGLGDRRIVKPSGSTDVPTTARLDGSDTLHVPQRTVDPVSGDTVVSMLPMAPDAVAIAWLRRWTEPRGAYASMCNG